MTEINLPEVLKRIIDGCYLVVYRKVEGRWARMHKIDAIEQLQRGDCLLDDPAGSQPDPVLLHSAFNKHK